MLKIRLNVRDARHIQHVRRAFKVVVQTAVIEVNRAHDGLSVIRDEHFCVDEAGVYSLILTPAFISEA